MLHMKNSSSSLEPCGAKSPSSCPFFKGGYHFENLEEMEKFFRQDSQVFPNVTEDRNQVITKDALAQLPNVDVKSVGLRGSYLYGLETSDSDIDLMIITSGKSHRPRQHIVGDVDYLAHSLDSFMRSINEGQLAETDVLYSGQMFDGEYEHLLRAIRVSPYTYYERSSGFAYNLLSSPPRQKGFNKGVKVASRSAILASKFYHYGHEFNPLFSAAEKSLLLRLTNESQQMLTENPPEDVRDFVFREALSLYSQ